MADFCSQCTPFEFPDIDLIEIAVNLKKGHSESFICEGCNNRGLYKDESGKLFLARQEAKEVKLYPVNIDELTK